MSKRILDSAYASVEIDDENRIVLLDSDDDYCCLLGYAEDIDDGDDTEGKLEESCALFALQCLGGIKNLGDEFSIAKAILPLLENDTGKKVVIEEANSADEYMEILNKYGTEWVNAVGKYCLCCVDE